MHSDDVSGFSDIQCDGDIALSEETCGVIIIEVWPELKVVVCGEEGSWEAQVVSITRAGLWLGPVISGCVAGRQDNTWA